jgi:hypothetical protein
MVALRRDFVEERVAPVLEGGGGHRRRRREGVCSGMDERARRGGGRAPVVLCPFYRQRSCGDGEGKWGRLARGATRRHEAGEGALF